MWKGIENLLLCEPRYVYVSIYNDQGYISLYWKLVKKIYNSNFILRILIIGLHFPYLYLLRKLMSKTKSDVKNRGMNLWIDMIDWLGGLPFEVATPKTKLLNTMLKETFYAVSSNSWK